jgi:hypothetical protein
VRAEAETTRLRMKESRDYWRNRATIAERNLAQAVRCVRELLKARRAAEEWLRRLNAAQSATDEGGEG